MTQPKPSLVHYQINIVHNTSNTTFDDQSTLPSLSDPTTKAPPLLKKKSNGKTKEKIKSNIFYSSVVLKSSF